MSDTFDKIEINDTCIYGQARNQNFLDMKRILGNKLLDYRIKKIRCQIKDNCIYGIQFFYRNINDGSIKAFIDVTSVKSGLTEQEFDINNEAITEMRTWLNNETLLIGFEVKTEKGRLFKFGYGNEEQLIKISDFQENERVIVGFGVYTDGENGITALYGQYIDKKKYISMIYGGIFSLKLKLKDANYKEKMDKKVDKMEEKNRILYRICQMPSNPFFNIIKYSIE
jgi:hypothetical protein